MINKELLQRVLEAKEERADFQKQLIDKYKLPLISLTLNLVGGYFQYNKWEAVLEEASKTIDNTFSPNLIFKKIRLGKWGAEGFWVIDLPIETVKKKAIKIEDSHSLGRLFDIDVIDLDGLSISRRDFGMKPRKCILCDNSAVECYIEKRHEREELMLKINEIIEEGLKSDDKR